MYELRFLEWPIYNTAQIFIKKIYGITNKFPQHFKYELGGQINRSAISIVLNIAEGSGKHSDADLNRFFNIALGSACETIAGLDIAHRNELISAKEFETLTNELRGIMSQLVGFKKKLRES